MGLFPLRSGDFAFSYASHTHCSYSHLLYNADSGQCCEASAAHYLGFTFMLLSTLSFTVLPLLLLLLPPPLADCSRTSVGYKDEAQAVPAPLSLSFSLSISLALCSVLFGCKGGDISVILMRKCEARVTFSLSLWDMRFSLTPPPSLSPSPSLLLFMYSCPHWASFLSFLAELVA